MKAIFLTESSEYLILDSTINLNSSTGMANAPLDCVDFPYLLTFIILLC